jgi:ribosomal protein L27
MAGSTNNKRDSAGRRLGIKRWGAAEVRRGEMIARQRGHKWHPGQNVLSSKDHTIHATMEGKVAWSYDKYAYKKRPRINVIPQETPNRNLPSPAPFVFHPELFPDLAGYNPEPADFVIPRP